MGFFKNVVKSLNPKSLLHPDKTLRSVLPKPVTRGVDKIGKVIINGVPRPIRIVPRAIQGALQHSQPFKPASIVVRDHEKIFKGVGRAVNTHINVGNVFSGGKKGDDPGGSPIPLAPAHDTGADNSALGAIDSAVADLAKQLGIPKSYIYWIAGGLLALIFLLPGRK